MSNMKDLYLVLVALAFMCAGLGAIVMWFISEQQYERHMQEIREMIQSGRERSGCRYLKRRHKNDL